MSKKIALSIVEPCHENWDKMTPEDKGRFCGSCQKQVIDFSIMSDSQVAQFFKKPSTGSVCGRFMTDQLNREIEIPRKRIPWVKYLFNFMLPAFFISKASAQNNIGKSKPENIDTIHTAITTEFRTLGMVLPKTIEPLMGDTTIVNAPVTDTKNIKGKIVSENGEPVSFASIQIGTSLSGYVADENGEFIIKENVIKENEILLISAIGYESKKVVINKNEKVLNVVLASNLVMGEIDVSSAKCYIAGGIRVNNINENKQQEKSLEVTDEIVERDISIPTSQNKFFVFPNPVFSGGNISLGVTMLDEAYYAVNFISLSGQLIQQKEIWIDKEAKVLNIEVPKVAAGSYFLVLTNKQSKKKMTEKIIIQ